MDLQTYWSQSGVCMLIAIQTSPANKCVFVQGKGIFLVRDLQQVLDRLESDRRNCKIASRPTPRIVQRYSIIPDYDNETCLVSL